MLRSFATAALSCAVLSAQGWVERTTLTGPGPRAGHAMCYDAARGYTMMVGGIPTTYGAPLEVWTWNGTNWTRRSGGSPPLNNSSADRMALAFHASTSEVVMVYDLATFTWDGTDWTPRGAVALGGATRPAAMAHDPVRNQTVLFLTERYQNIAYPAETYVWDGIAWALRNPVTRPIGDAVGMAYDPAASRLLLCTNYTLPSGPQTAFWEWTGTNWQQRFFASAPSAGGTMAADTANNRVVMLDGVMTSTPNHTWTFANGQGTQLSTPIEPARRVNSAITYDSVRGRFVLFGGRNGALYSELGDTWEFAPGAGASYAVYGSGCAGSRGVPTLNAQGTSLPRVGQAFTAHVGNLPFTSPVFLFLGLSDTFYGPTPLPFPLAGIGAPGCSVLASGDELHVLTNVLGSAAWSFQVPSFAGLQFYNQAIVLDPGVNALGLTVSNGGRATIGF